MKAKNNLVDIAENYLTTVVNNGADDLIALVDAEGLVADPRFGIIAGEPSIKEFVSAFQDWLKYSGIHNLHDFNCGLKAYRQDVVKNIGFRCQEKEHKVFAHPIKGGQTDSGDHDRVHPVVMLSGRCTHLGILFRYGHPAAAIMGQWADDFSSR
mgnify:CR=1 FL=1